MAIDYSYEAASIDATGADDFFSVPELVVPPSPPEAHRAVITSVTTTTLNNEKQSTKISINLTSRDVPTVDKSLDIWVPKEYLAVIGSPTFDPTTLAQGQQISFRMNFSNSDKSATLQKLVFNPSSVARSAGRDPIQLGLKKVAPGDLEGFVSNLNAMLQGLEVIMLLRERGGEPPYNHTLEVKDILAADAYETSPKRFQKYQLAWENT
jgi:hypothetical protein